MKKILSLVLIVSFLSFFGCKKDSSNPIDTSAGGQLGNPSGQPIPTVANVDGWMATILFGYTAPIIGSVDYSMGYAQFGLTYSVNAGAVTVNANTLTATYNNESTYYTSFSTLSPSTLTGVNFDGTSAHTWTVGGGNGVPAFTASITSPRNFSISSPVSGATVSKASGIPVTWTVVGASASDSIMIVLAPASSGGTAYTSATLSNSGSFTIPASGISSLSGDVLLQVVKFRYALKTVGSKNYAIISEIVRTANFKVN
jgi:hypothetical protein